MSVSRDGEVGFGGAHAATAATATATAEHLLT